MGIRDLGALESAIAQPYMTFAGNELYPSLAEKAATLGFSLIQNHPFADGNKRTGHAAMESFLVLNGSEIQSSAEEQMELILSVASGKLTREDFAAWLSKHIHPAKRLKPIKRKGEQYAIQPNTTLQRGRAKS